VLTLNGRRGISLMALTFAALTSLPAHAAEAEGPSSATLQELFAALSQGRFDAADRAAAALDAAGDDKTLHQTFTRAARFVASGDCESGLPMAENVIARAPLFLPAYDLAGSCLAQAGDAAGAAQLYDAAAGQLPDGPDKAMLADRAAALRPDMSAKFGVEANLQPSTNVNRGTSATSIGGWTISESSRGREGVAASLFGTVEKPLLVSKTLIAGVSLKAGLQYDSVSGDLMPTVQAGANIRRILSPSTSIGLSAAYEHVIRDGTTYTMRPSVAADFAHRHSDVLSVGGGVEVAHVDHVDDGQDGWTFKLHGNAVMTKGAGDRFTLRAAVTREERESARHSNTLLAAEGEWERMIANGFIGSLGAGASLRLHDGNAALTSDRQRDTQVFVSAGVSHRDLMFGAIRPELSYRLTRQWSNDVFSDYTAHDVAIRAKASF
jgi:hypothetical protein